jgi:hypothetical protein
LLSNSLPEETPSANQDDDITTSRLALQGVVNKSHADPVELSQRYIEECTNNFTSRELGSGAFGTVYLGSDPTLGIQLAVKRVPLAVPTEDRWKEITLSFRKEIAVSFTGSSGNLWCSVVVMMMSLCCGHLSGFFYTFFRHLNGSVTPTFLFFMDTM